MTAKKTEWQIIIHCDAQEQQEILARMAQWRLEKTLAVLREQADDAVVEAALRQLQQQDEESPAPVCLSWVHSK